MRDVREVTPTRIPHPCTHSFSVFPSCVLLLGAIAKRKPSNTVCDGVLGFFEALMILFYFITLYPVQRGKRGGKDLGGCDGIGGGGIMGACSLASAM